MEDFPLEMEDHQKISEDTLDHQDRVEEILEIMLMGEQADSVNMELMEEATTTKETLVDQDQEDLITREVLTNLGEMEETVLMEALVHLHLELDPTKMGFKEEIIMVDRVEIAITLVVLLDTVLGTVSSVDLHLVMEEVVVIKALGDHLDKAEDIVEDKQLEVQVLVLVLVLQMGIMGLDMVL